jgi:hypothetical protein
VVWKKGKDGKIKPETVERKGYYKWQKVRK